MTRILVVDDQLCVRRLVCDELADEGYEVVEAPDAKTVGDRLASEKIDLVVLDLYLDGSEGWKLLRSMKKAQPDLPVVIFTAYDTFLDDPRLKDANDYIVKSMDLDPLKTAIAEALTGRRVSEFRSDSVKPDVRVAYEYKPVV